MKPCRQRDDVMGTWRTVGAPRAWNRLDPHSETSLPPLSVHHGVTQMFFHVSVTGSNMSSVDSQSVFLFDLLMCTLRKKKKKLKIRPHQ